MIVFRHVSKNFGEKRILDAVDLRIETPGMIALTGASGTGKTTIARMLLGLDRDFSGEIRGLPEKRACVFQEDRLLPQLTAAQNIRFVTPRVDGQKMAQGFAALGIAADIDTPVTQLSGGMKRRVSILRALLSDAELIVMDEPMKGLDEAIARQTAQYCRQMLLGRTLIYITHAMEEIDWLGIGRILRLENAKIR